MDGIKNLNLNVNVTVFSPEPENRKTAAKIFRGRIYNKEDNNMIIHIENGGGSELLSVGKPIFLFLAHDLGLFVYSARIHSKVVENEEIIVSCSKPRQHKNFQRRNSVRVKVNIPVRYSMDFNNAKELTGIISDISVKGLQLQSPSTVPVGADLELRFQLESTGTVYVKGTVVRTFEKNEKIFLGIKFIDIDKQVEDDIARFLMAEQMRQKRLGLQLFKAFIFNASVRVKASTEFCIIQYKSLDVSTLRSKKSRGELLEIGIHGIIVESPLNLPLGAKIEFSVELPKLGYTIIQAVVQEVAEHQNKYIIHADYSIEHEKIRDCILEQMAGDFDIPEIKC